MRMTVMHIGIMSVTVSKRGMAMQVSMRLARKIIRPMAVLMMFVVGVSMIRFCRSKPKLVS